LHRAPDTVAQELAESRFAEAAGVGEVERAAVVGCDDAGDLPVGARARQVDLAGDALAPRRRIGRMAQHQRVALMARLDRPPEGVVAHPVDRGAQFAAAPGEAHAARRNALEGAVQALDGAIDSLGVPRDLEHCRPNLAA
jgi:hypothetical protein